MILILSARAHISEVVASSHRLQRSEFRHVFNEDQLRGMAGTTLWLTPSAYRLRNIDRILEMASACRLKVIEIDINREQEQ